MKIRPSNDGKGVEAKRPVVNPFADDFSYEDYKKTLAADFSAKDLAVGEKKKRSK